MFKSLFTGLQRQLLVLLIVALMPIYGYFVVSSIAIQRESLNQATLDVQAVSRLSAFGVERTVEGTRQLLNAITSGPSLKGSGLNTLCLDFLANIGKDYPYYTNLAVLDLNGNLTCDGMRMAAGGNFADRPYFKQALATRSFVMEDYQVGQVTSKPSITFAMPFFDNSGLLKGVAVVALDLTHLAAGLKAPRQANMHVSVMDSNGVILGSNNLQSEVVGSKFASPGYKSAMRTLPREPFEASDAKGEMKIYSVELIETGAAGEMFVVTSIARDVVTAPAERAALVGLLLLSALAITGILAARWIGNKTLVAPARRLLRDIHGLAHEDPAGVQVQHTSSDEMTALTSAFNRVAAVLKLRDAELERDHESLLNVQYLLNMATRVSQLGAWRVNLMDEEVAVELSDIASAIHGLPPGSKLSVEKAINFYVPASAEIVRALFENCVNNGVPFDTELQMVTVAGTKIWVRSIGEAVRNPKGTIVRVQGALQDISAQKLAEENNVKMEARLTTTLETISDGFATFDRNWRFTYLNTQAEKLFRRDRAELLGQLFEDVFPVIEGTSFVDNYLIAIREKRSVHFEDFYPPLGLWLDLTVYPSELGLAIYFRDVTSQRAAKEHLHLMQSAVSRLNDIVVITDAVITSDSSPRIVFVNAAFEQRTGYQRAEVIGKSPKFLQGPGTDRVELDRIRTSLEKWQSVRAELRNYTKAGQPFWLELNIVPIADEKGVVTHWVAVERDITERKRTEEEILELNVELEDRVQLRTAQLEAANRELEAFSYSVSHDLRSPLNTINGFGQLLQKSNEENLSEKGKHYLSRIRAGARQMGELIDGLLSLAKMAREPLHLQILDLSEIAQQFERQCREREPGREVLVVIQSGMKIYADTTVLFVVMQNLFDNAWKYTSKKTAARIDVGTTLGAEAETIYFVKDNGAGFDMAYADKLFGVFQRLHSPLEFAGTGVGLANVRRVIERHGGRVWAEGTPGEGATFYFTVGNGDSLALTPQPNISSA